MAKQHRAKKRARSDDERQDPDVALLSNQHQKPPGVDKESSAEEKIAEMEEEVRAEKKKIAQMEEEINAMNEELRDEKKKIAEMEEEVRAEKKKIAAMEEELNAMKAALVGETVPPNGYAETKMFAWFVEQAAKGREKFAASIAEKEQLISKRISEEKQRISEEKQRISDKEQRISEEKQRISEEKQRISDKEQLVSKEKDRIAKEKAPAAQNGVSAPPPTSTAPMPRPTPGPIGELPAGVTAEVDAVAISGGALGLGSATLLVRNRYYPAVWQEVSELLDGGKKSMVVVLGQPGIGKTVGLGNYCVLRCVEKLPDAVVAIAELADVFRVVTTNAGKRTCLLFNSPAAFKEHLLALAPSVKLLLVHDVKTSNNAAPFPLNFTLVMNLRDKFRTICVVAMMSPQFGNYSFAPKMEMKLKFIALPTWSDAELMAGGFITGPHDAKLYLRGGVPRSYLFSDKDMVTQIDNASAVFDVTKMHTLELGRQWSSTLLVQLIPAPCFSTFQTLLPLSRRAAEVLASRHGPQLHANFKAQMTLHGSFDGHLVDWWFLSLLRSVRPVVPPTGSSIAPARCDIELPLRGIPGGAPLKVVYKHKHVRAIKAFRGTTMTRMFDEEITPLLSLPTGEHKEHVVLIPEAPNFPVVDAVVLTRRARSTTWSMVAFQCTVAANHPAAEGAADEFRRCLGKAGVVLRKFVYVGLGSGGTFRGVTGVQATQDGKPFFATAQWRMDIAEATTRGA